VPQSFPTRIGRYEIQDELGRGTMGVVYRAHDPELGRTIALKTVSLAFAVSQEDREAFNRRFVEEARIAARLSHPGIVVVHEVGRDPASGTLYMALEHLRGRTLAETVGGGRALPWREAVRLGIRVARALEHAHAQGIVHRDIKPANIMVLDSGEAKVLDFGVAKAPASQLTAAGQFFGTPAYMSPEQVEGRPLDGRSDVFSLGCVLYLALTGRRPFDGENVPLILSRVLHDTAPPPSRSTPGLPPALDHVVARAMAKEPAARYADAGALADDLEAVLDGRPVATLAGPAIAPGQATRVARGKATGPAAPEGQSLDLEPTGRATVTGAARRPGALRRSAVVGGTVVALALAGYRVLSREPRTAAVADKAEGGADAGAQAPGLLQRWTGALEPARLSIEFDHHLKSGMLEVWVDDELVLEEPIEGRLTKKILSFRLRKGSVQQTLEVAPGVHEIRAQVTWDGRHRSASISGNFKAGVTRRLDVSVSRLTREVGVDWR
jgi:serine/threonine-protein kinase